MGAGRMNVRLRSRTPQTITVRFPRAVRKLTASETDGVNVKESVKGPAFGIVSLPAEK
jgi:hypothetical protein